MTDDVTGDAALGGPPEPPEAATPAEHAERGERYVRAVAAIPELGQDQSGWVADDDRTRALIERGLLVEAEPPGE